MLHGDRTFDAGCAARTNEFRRARCKGGGRLDEIAYRSASRSGQALLVPTAYAKNDDKN